MLEAILEPADDSVIIVGVSDGVTGDGGETRCPRIGSGELVDREEEILTLPTEIELSGILSRCEGREVGLRLVSRLHIRRQ
ncbi:MAG: hypothetical protein M3Y03_04025, partial [Verrucomicrobiota bacterium]|nr:hypothetical protein [Verrucomicrobiota bacterium]